MKIGIIGAGTWGMALANMLSKKGYEVIVWSAIEKEIKEYSTKRVHPKLPGMIISNNIVFTKNIEYACTNKDIILVAVPSVFMRSTARQMRPYISEGQIVVNVAKGIEADTLMTMTEIIENEICKDKKNNYIKLVALSGPTHAEEVAKELPTTIVSASYDLAASEFVKDVFSNENMKVYTTTDVFGVELCGALKNIIALAAGISDGMGYGDNAKAAIITKGIQEIMRLGMAIGCRLDTFYGLAGIGDLIVTATSKHSRNNKAGILIGQGYSAEKAIEEVGMVVEGINALPAAIKMCKTYKIDLPIINAVAEIIYDKGDLNAVAKRLMTKYNLKNE